VKDSGTRNALSCKKQMAKIINTSFSKVLLFRPSTANMPARSLVFLADDVGP
jgi:hypothetical protein